MTTQRTALHLLQQDSQMLFAQHHGYHISKPCLEVSCAAPVQMPPFVAHEVISKGRPSLSPSSRPPANKRKGRGGIREEGSCSERCKMSRGEKVTHPKNVRRVSVADKLSLPVSFTSLAVICNSSEAERGLRIISGWHLPSQETPFF